jgi:GcrA cell cycle regulator
MGWTDERVELLKKLWMEGLSASQIANELGEGVTRNAVIGKVHRLKLSARAKPASAAPRPRSPSRPTVRRPSSSGGSVGLKRRVMQSAPTIGATALKPSEEYAIEAEPELAEVHELFIPEGERLSLLDLSEQTCKWPIGDPLNPDFHFCGRMPKDDHPYCEFHARRAYHQVDRKKR